MVHIYSIILRLVSGDSWLCRFDYTLAHISVLKSGLDLSKSPIYSSRVNKLNLIAQYPRAALLTQSHQREICKKAREINPVGVSYKKEQSKKASERKNHRGQKTMKYSYQGINGIRKALPGYLKSTFPPIERCPALSPGLCLTQLD